MRVTKAWYENSYATLGLATQRRYPNEELLRFMGGCYFGIDRAQRRQVAILEVGCGSGANLRVIAREGFDAYRMDLSEEALKLCRSMLEDWQVEANFAPARKIDSSTLDGIRRETSPYHGNNYPFRFVAADEYAAALVDRGLVVSSNERIGRTYRGGTEYFEFVSIAAQKQ